MNVPLPDLAAGAVPGEKSVAVLSVRIKNVSKAVVARIRAGINADVLFGVRISAAKELALGNVFHSAGVEGPCR